MKEILKWAFRAVIWVILTGIVTNKIYHVLFQAPELSYVTRTYSLFPGIKSNDAIVKLFVNDEQVETLYMTTIRLENSGGIALERNDFAAERDPLRITGQNIKSVFIDDTNSRYNSETNVNERGAEFLLNFKWLNPGDYITVNVLHDKPCSNIRLQGSFANVGKAKGVSFEQYVRKKAMFHTMLLTLFVMLTSAVLCFILFILSNKLTYGVFWISFDQYIAYIYVKSCEIYKKSDRKGRKQIIGEIVNTKDRKTLNKLIDKYCNKRKR